MTLPRFEVYCPSTLEEALDHLARVAGGGGRILAGGTDLLVDLKRPLYQRELYPAGGPADEAHPAVLTTLRSEEWETGALPGWEPPVGPLISLHKLVELKRIAVEEDGSLLVGALATAREIQRSPEIRGRWTALAEGADELGSPLVRARGTLGGNLCNARPAADMAVPSFALGAELTLRSSSGTRTVPVQDFITGPGRTVRRPDEILTRVRYPASNPWSGSAYYKLAQRKALDISVVGVAAWIELEGKDGPVRDARLALGAVGPTPLPSPGAAALLRGVLPGEEVLRKAAAAAAVDARPIDDHRGSAEYRRRMVEVLALRVLKKAVDRAGEAS